MQYDESLRIENVQILLCLYYVKESSIYEISKLTGISTGTVSRCLNYLVEQRFVAQPESRIDSGRHKKIYKLTEKGLKLVKEWKKKKLNIEELAQWFGHSFKKSFVDIGILLTVSEQPLSLKEFLQAVTPLYVFIGEINNLWKIENNKVKITSKGFEMVCSDFEKFIDKTVRYYQKIAPDRCKRFLEKLVKSL